LNPNLCQLNLKSTPPLSYVVTTERNPKSVLPTPFRILTGAQKRNGAMVMCEVFAVDIDAADKDQVVAAIAD
jgi:hypothetical protein